MSKPKLSFKQAFAEIKKIMGFEDTAAAGDNNAVDAQKDYTTDSGSKLKIDKLEVGGTVYQEDGTTPVTTGVTLSDGTIIEVSETGVITKVTVPDAPPAATDINTPDQVTMRAMVAKFATGTPDDRVANLEAMCTALMENCFGWQMDQAEVKTVQDTAIAAYKTLGIQLSAQLATEKKERETEATKFNAAMQKVLTVLEQFADEPADDPAQNPSDKPPAESKKDRANRLLMAAKEAKK